MRTKTPKRNENVALRLDQKLRASLDLKADEERRPLASLIRNALEDFIRDHPPAATGNQTRAA